MQLWIAGEINHDVGDAFRAARKVVETAFNEHYGATGYGASVAKWAYIAMISPPGTGFEEEINRYDKRDRCLEFRLRIDHGAFLAANTRAREGMIVSALRRSLVLAEGMHVPDLALAQLRRDVDSLATKQGWP